MYIDWHIDIEIANEYVHLYPWRGQTADTHVRLALCMNNFGNFEIFGHFLKIVENGQKNLEVTIESWIHHIL